MALTGRQLSAYEVARVAYSAGIPLDRLEVCVAVCWGESNFWTEAYNGRGDDKSYGLWQINMIGSVGPERRRKYGFARNEDLYVPENNARVMVDMSSKGRNWNPWGAYTDGGYISRGGMRRAIPAVERLRWELRPSTYTVIPGDSLMTIGARLGLDWHRIATANEIVAPYIIQPGQVLRIPA